MKTHPYVQPHPPQETCMACNKPLLDPCHDTPYGEIMPDYSEYRLIQDGVVVCSASGPNARNEILHYGCQYIQDGPIRIEIKKGGKWILALAATGPTILSEKIKAATDQDAITRLRKRAVEIGVMSSENDPPKALPQDL